MKQEAKAGRTHSQTDRQADRRTDRQADRLRPVAGRHNQRLKEAFRSGLHLESVFFSESARHLAERLLPQIHAQKIHARTETLVLPDALFNSIVPSDAPQGVAALVKLRA